MQKQRINMVRTLLAVLVLLFTFFSVFFTAHEHFHECSGEDCPICHVIQISEQNIKLFSFIVSVIAISKKINFVERQVISVACKPAFLSATLVSQKIRLND